MTCEAEIVQIARCAIDYRGIQCDIDAKVKFPNVESVTGMFQLMNCKTVVLRIVVVIIIQFHQQHRVRDSCN